MKESDYDDVVDTNLKGAFNFIRHCCPLMMKKRSGKIINITSVSAVLPWVEKPVASRLPSAAATALYTL